MGLRERYFAIHDLLSPEELSMLRELMDSMPINVLNTVGGIGTLVNIIEPWNVAEDGGPVPDEERRDYDPRIDRRKSPK